MSKPKRIGAIIQELYDKYLETKSDEDATKLYNKCIWMMKRTSAKLADGLTDKEREDVILQTASKIFLLAPTMYDRSKAEFSSWINTCLKYDMWALTKNRIEKRTYNFSQVEAAYENGSQKYDNGRSLYEDEDPRYTDDINEVMAVVESLNEPYRTALKLVTTTKSYNEICQITGWKMDTTKSRIHTARRLFKEKYKPKRDE